MRPCTVCSQAFMNSSIKTPAVIAGARQLRANDALAFLPATLEITETPPSPIGRAISLILVAVFCAAIGWASLGKVDIIASAQGKIVPSGRSKVVQPFDTGVVRAIHVRDGQHVKVGEVLIELDPTIDRRAATTGERSCCRPTRRCPVARCSCRERSDRRVSSSDRGACRIGCNPAPVALGPNHRTAREAGSD